MTTSKAAAPAKKKATAKKKTSAKKPARPRRDPATAANLPVLRTPAPTRVMHDLEPAFSAVWEHFATLWRADTRGYDPEPLLQELLSPGRRHA